MQGAGPCRFGLAGVEGSALEQIEGAIKFSTDTQA